VLFHGLHRFSLTTDSSLKNTQTREQRGPIFILSQLQEKEIHITSHSKIGVPSSSSKSKKISSQSKENNHLRPEREEQSLQKV